MTAPEVDCKTAPPAGSALAARELESAVNSKELWEEHVARTGGKVSEYARVIAKES